MKPVVLTAFIVTMLLVTVNGESGQCSWYGAAGEIPQGHPTACGEGFDRFALKVAHKTLPCGTRLRVRNTQTGQSVDVTVNDRGPFVPGRILDMTYEAFGRIGNRDDGVISCDYQTI
ncbi:RlpA-like lipoprotein [Orchesella cincta]|uniref:RlpA-like lipoprotein n=1 Tax=Orchesella cincta TaxID=48709 RepID=A0A1D2M5I1_ORCCI|nr:RlpA-like lipoprotein [Orchesella cincta]